MLLILLGILLFTSRDGKVVHISLEYTILLSYRRIASFLHVEDIKDFA
jgi:hypothetical protein